MIYHSGDFPAPLSPDEPEFVSFFPELSQKSRRALVMEQLRIERMVCFQEIEALRKLLRQHHIDDSQVAGWQARSDNILDTLLRYGKGELGRRNQDKTLFRPWSWRRRCRNHFE